MTILVLPNFLLSSQENYNEVDLNYNLEFIKGWIYDRFPGEPIMMCFTPMEEKEKELGLST